MRNDPECSKGFWRFLDSSETFRTFSRKVQNVLESSPMFPNILECSETKYRMLQNVFRKILEYSINVLKLEIIEAVF